MIAAGGTAGHVLPALAVAEALTARGVYVTFAGSPDRVEAQLVPDAGYELDTFRDQRLSAAALARRSLAPCYRAGASPHACRAILRRRGCDVVFGAGGYVAGPMVLRGGDDADARCALGGRRAPRARQPARASVREARLPRLPDRGSLRAALTGSSAVRSRRGPGRSRRRRRARSSSCRPRGRCCSSPGRSPGPARSTSSSIEAFGEVGPAVLHISGERDYGSLRSRLRRTDYRLIPTTERIGAAYSAADLVARARRQLDLGARRRGQAGDPRPLPVRDRRPPGEERRAFRQGRRGDDDPRPRPRRRPRPGPHAASRPGAAGADGGGDAPGREARRGRRDRRGADRACPSLDGRRLWFVGIGGAGLSAYAQLARAWGAEVGGWDRVVTPYLDPLVGIELAIAPSRSCRQAARRSSPPPTPPFPGSGAPSSSPSSSRCAARSSSAARTARGRPRR